MCSRVREPFLLRATAESVAVSYGSPAGELAACVSAAGIADSSHLTKLEICGPAGRLAELTHYATGGSLAPGGVIDAPGAWWCGAGGASPSFSAQRVVVLCDPLGGERLHELLRARAARLPGARRPRPHSGLGGDHGHRRRRAGRARIARGVRHDRESARRVSVHERRACRRGGAVAARVRPHRALALVPASVAGAAWHAIERAGRRHRMCCVGQEAIARYELLAAAVARRSDRRPRARCRAGGIGAHG